MFSARSHAVMLLFFLFLSISVGGSKHIILCASAILQKAAQVGMLVPAAALLLAASPVTGTMAQHGSLNEL